VFDQAVYVDRNGHCRRSRSVFEDIDSGGNGRPRQPVHIADHLVEGAHVRAPCDASEAQRRDEEEDATENLAIEGFGPPAITMKAAPASTEMAPLSIIGHRPPIARRLMPTAR
jgi:hypothetical protein